MFHNLKKTLYFPIASYFRFFAKIKLRRWNPKVIVITGSSGKTTTMNLAVAEFGDAAFYSYHANSAYGIPFNILSLKRETLQPQEWIYIFLAAPFKVFSKIPKQRIYVVEADCDRPGEGVFLSKLLKPEVTVWLSSSRTHSMNFDSQVASQKFENVEESIAYEYGHFVENTSKLVIVNSDSELINSQLKRTKADVIKIKDEDLREYKVSTSKTEYKTHNKTYKLDFLLPKAAFYSIFAVFNLTKYFDIPFDESFKKFNIPPGRSSIFKGIRETTLIDSSYNTGFAAYNEIINMFNQISGEKKWAVIGDILEQGKEEKEEHEKLADLVVKSDFDHVILLGPRIKKYGLEVIKDHYKNNVASFLSPKEVLDHLMKNLSGGEIVLFKGARFLEGVIENLLKDKEDIAKLARREKVWQERREKWGL